MLVGWPNFWSYFFVLLLAKVIQFLAFFFIFFILGADNEKKISHLKALQSLGELKIFGADLTEEGSFDAPVAGCDLVFHVATPVNFASEDPEVHKTA